MVLNKKEGVGGWVGIIIQSIGGVVVSEIALIDVGASGKGDWRSGKGTKNGLLK